MTIMLAGRLDFEALHFEVSEVEVPEPGAGEVRIRVGAAGICLSDVHLIDGTLSKEQVRGHYGYEPADLVTIVDLVRWHRLDFTDSVSGVLALADAAEGVRRLSAKEGNPIRLVLKP